MIAELRGKPEQALSSRSVMQMSLDCDDPAGVSGTSGSSIPPNLSTAQLLNIRFQPVFNDINNYFGLKMIKNTPM